MEPVEAACRKCCTVPKNFGSYISKTVLGTQDKLCFGVLSFSAQVCCINAGFAGAIVLKEIRAYGHRKEHDDATDGKQCISIADGQVARRLAPGQHATERHTQNKCGKITRDLKAWSGQGGVAGCQSLRALGPEVLGRAEHPDFWCVLFRLVKGLVIGEQP